MAAKKAENDTKVAFDERIEKIADPLIKGYLMYILDEKKKQLNVQNQL